MERLSFRMEQPLREAANAIAQECKAADFSDYVRGLIVADALLNGKNIEGVSIPGWIVGKLIDVKTKSAEGYLKWLEGEHERVHGKRPEAKRSSHSKAS